MLDSKESEKKEEEKEAKIAEINNRQSTRARLAILIESTAFTGVNACLLLFLAIRTRSLTLSFRLTHTHMHTLVSYCYDY